tara:strand:+ start:207 stop:491 length:285 start_codon:yes stop_codon:yes gene_type:complete
MKKAKIAIPTRVPLISLQVRVRWVFNNQDKEPIENDICVMLMENKEEMANVNKENWITLSKAEIKRFIMPDLIFMRFGNKNFKTPAMHKKNWRT